MIQTYILPLNFVKKKSRKFRKDIDLQSLVIYVDQKEFQKTYKFEEIVQLVCTMQIGDIEQGMV